MTELLNYIDRIILFLVVIFLFFMLRKLLGKNVGYTREEHLKKQQQMGEIRELKPVSITKEVSNTFEYPVGSLAHTLSMISQKDQNFSAKKFLESAKKAFILIVTAFVNEDLSNVKHLISTKVYNVFNESIQSRKERGEKILFVFKSFLLTDITASKIENDNVYITVKLVTEQIRENVANDSSTNVEDIKAKQIAESWVFYKNYKENKSVWELVKIFS